MYKKRSRVRAVDGRESGASPVCGSSGQLRSYSLGLFFISDTSLLSDMPCQPEREREKDIAAAAAAALLQ
jgi:hypothetical protein